MKRVIQLLLQKVFGFQNYLFIFSVFKIKTLKWDRNERAFFDFMKFIPDDCIILDIGANIGIMTVMLAKKFPSSTVFSFEPIPQNISALKRVIKYFHLSNVKIFECALGESEGEVEMVMPVVSSVKMQGLSHVVHESIGEFNDGIKFKTPLRMLDNITELFSSEKKISAIKIDVENFEYFVLSGGKKLLEKNKPVIYAELWKNENREKCFVLLGSLGYKIFVLDKNALKVFDGVTESQYFIFKTN